MPASFILPQSFNIIESPCWTPFGILICSVSCSIRTISLSGICLSISSGIPQPLYDCSNVIETVFIIGSGGCIGTTLGPLVRIGFP